MEEKSWRRNHEGGIMKEDSSRKDNERRISEEASGSIRGFLGGIWEASGGIWKHLGGL